MQQTLPCNTFGVIPGRGRSPRTRNPENDIEYGSGFRVRAFSAPRNDSGEVRYAAVASATGCFHSFKRGITSLANIVRLETVSSCDRKPA